MDAPAWSQADSQLRKTACLNRMLPLPLPNKSPSKIPSKVIAREEPSKLVPKGATHSTSSNQDLHLGMFEIGKPLGKGKFGRVYLAKHRPSGYICALKVLQKDEISREGAEVHVRREIEVHSHLRHPGILAFHTWFHDSRRIFLILEYAPGGELYKELRRAGRFPEPRAAHYAAQVAQALSYLHNKNVIHRDIKPENILVGLYGELEIADFGYSVHSPSNRRETLCGTLDYLPPEMLGPKKSKYTRAVDQWTLGVLTYEFLTGEAPFEDTQVLTQRRIVKGDMKPLPASTSRLAKDFIHSLLVVDPSKRLPLDQVMTHPWITKYCTRREFVERSKEREDKKSRHLQTGS
ncbi:Serine/threonine-protein kinase ark1 [Neonectria ditissima]|uniref:Aurora kinase n=1 Tax=Neonectria ditissima TaxID=78410 RepID=A0A0P7B6C3_9HYPO|nr:Serine/threonine-protein kinase ark1 [Neonectria ditissima]